MRTRALPLLAIPLILLDPWPGTNVPRGADEQAVRETVDRYFDGLNGGDPEALSAMLDEDARMLTVAEGGSVERFSIRVRPRAEGRSRGRRSYVKRITLVDVSGGAAVVRADVRCGGAHHHVEYLSLLKVGGEWRIVSNVSSAAAPAWSG